MSTLHNHVVFLCHYFHPRIGGVEKHVYQVSRALIKRNYQVTAISSQYDSNLPVNEIINNIRVIRIKLSSNNWHHPSKTELWPWMFNHIKLFKQAGLVHCHDVFYWYLPLRFLLPHVPIFTTFHGYEGVCPPSRKAILIRKISEKLSKGNVCVGDYIIKWYGTKSDEVIYGGTLIPEKIPLPTTTKSALFLGRIDNDSGIHIYLQALSQLKKQGLYIKAEFCGGGSLENEAKKYGKLLGFQKDITKPLLRNRFAFVSSYLTILEAMAHKRLVFAVYDNPLKRDTLLMSPFTEYINISSTSTELAQQIKYYLTNKSAENEIVEKAFKWVKSQTWSVVADQYEKLWLKKVKF